MIDWILVPQGAEYQAIKRGKPKSSVLAIPIGGVGLKEFLDAWVSSPTFTNNIPKQVLLMGLGGSLSPRYRQGDGLIFSECIRERNYQDVKKFDESLTTILLDKLQNKISLVRGLSCDRLLINATEKQSLGQEYQVDGVEMEGFTVLEILQPLGVKVAMIRVISDDCTQDLPDLREAITPNGSLNPWQLIIKMLQSPVAAFGLIQGSLTGLKKLEILTRNLV